MPKTFERQLLWEVDRVDSSGDFVSREVMAKALAELQLKMGQGIPVFIAGKIVTLDDVQGLVTGIYMEGNEVFIDGTILDTGAGGEVQKLLVAEERAREEGRDPEDPIVYAMSGTAKVDKDPEKGVNNLSSLSIGSVIACRKSEKVK